MPPWWGLLLNSEISSLGHDPVMTQTITCLNWNRHSNRSAANCKSLLEDTRTGTNS